MAMRQKCYTRAVLLLLVVLLGAFVFTMWFGMNSDKDNIYPIVTQLIPAGHCTCEHSTTFNCTSCLAPFDYPISTTPEPPRWAFQYRRDDRNEGLSRSQCQAAFPGLFEDVNRAVQFWKPQGGITRKQLDKIKLQKGMARGMIYGGELYVIETRAAQDDHRRKILAIFSSIHRAISADCGNLPDIEFTFSIEDRLDDIKGNGQPLWTLARKASEESVWLMPDFGFWAWHNPGVVIGPYSEVVEKIKKREEAIPWASKERKLVWRGNLGYAPKLRRKLLEVAKGKTWGDVKELVWSRKSNLISMENHCQYMFIAHVEGRAFSSSLKYRQACRSVVVTHKLQFIQHHHYLLQADGPRQNYVEVERDFSDLEEKMEALLHDEEHAKLIADNSVKAFRERYLTKAAEACYWRELINGWGIVFSNSGNGVEPEAPGVLGPAWGTRYESFILLESKNMMEFSHPS
ncbi:hypothetical protein EMCG_08915 [[Emmonsia] crescens]|uniref:Glycosyl transferase CAP10 domain-containing protein n=1 Tax=[Emmonsia] crescens TaxID=73230 RepID=A0A0G2I444_9EURO|nr:hypothetical protein EMCG_08915 [Emmonsia crescens UAMH 3008]